MARLERGTRVDRYEVQSQLGRGGMAVVYEVRDVETSERYALKVLALKGSPEGGRLMREGRLQGALKHPNILGVIDAISVDGDPALVLEYCDGLPLGDWLQEHPNVDDAMRWRLAKHIIDAVAHAHAHGTIHRDLKPANVLLAGSWERPTAKVADFGLAKFLNAADASTQTGVRMGTPRYMAPEQFMDAKRVDERADVFSLGCILYELWCGKPAFGGTTAADIFDQVLAADYVVPPHLPAPVAAAIRGALEPDLDKRTPSVAAMVAILDDRPPPPPLRPSVPPPRRRDWTLLVVGVGCVIAFAPLVLGVVVALWLLARGVAP